MPIFFYLVEGNGGPGSRAIEIDDVLGFKQIDFLVGDHIDEKESYAPMGDDPFQMLDLL